VVFVTLLRNGFRQYFRHPCHSCYEEVQTKNIAAVKSMSEVLPEAIPGPFKTARLQKNCCIG